MYAEKIENLKKEKDFVILAHYYVDGEVQKVADYVGDSFYLSKVATQVSAKNILFAGVQFMGESAKLLNPSKHVYMADDTADCPMAHMVTLEQIAEVREKYDDVAVDVWQMFRELYKQHSIRDNHFFSNRNLIVSYFFSPEEQIFLSEEEYIYIWQTVDAVMHADNESWVYNYWTYANQYYIFTLDHYSENDGELKWQQKRFKEQHFMLGALLAYNKKYELLNQLMYFTNTKPQRYVLVPSSFNSVISQLKHLIDMIYPPLNLRRMLVRMNLYCVMHISTLLCC